MDYNNAINETHICVLEREDNTDRLKVSLTELNFQFESSMTELKQMSENANRSICELERYVESSPLECLFGAFDYCNRLDNAYEGIKKYSKTDYEDYLKKISEFDCLIKAEEDSKKIKAIEHNKEFYISQLREDFYRQMIERKKGYMPDVEFVKNKRNSKIMAFSHRRVGYNFPEFKLGNDFIVIFKTNFGYGMASYFFTNIRYKGIDILPYSDLIRYQFADISEIIRYTRHYPLLPSSWKYIMDFTAETYNHSISSPETFVEKWIMNECREMVAGLEDLLNKKMDSTYIIYPSFFNKNQQIKLSGIELINFKGERISGSLSFLEKISELKGISSHVDGLTNRIMNCNLIVYSQLKMEINTLEKNIININHEIDKILPKWTLLNEVMRKYSIIKDEFRKVEHEKQPHLNYSATIFLVDKLLNAKYPEYKGKQKEFEFINKIYSDLRSKLKKDEVWKKKFEGYKSVIERHFDSIGKLDSLNSVA